MTRKRFFSLTLVFVASIVMQSCGAAVAADNASGELLYPGEDFAKLDTFEAVALEDADKLFIKKDYKGAYAAYKAYSFEFADGQALPYVLLRMGRCLHLLDKRNTAITAYQDVVDYFPDDVAYAAAALYYIGQCHALNGNEAKSLATWARLAKDKDYVRQPRSGSALAELATAMEKRGDFEEATSYRWRTAVAFRESNVKAAEAARANVVYHYTVRVPNQEKLLEFCNEAGGFGWRTPIAIPEESTTYWSHVLQTVLRSNAETQEKEAACRYWSNQMGDRFVENDALRVLWFSVQRVYEKDRAKWAQRMETQFKLKPISLAHLQQWISHYSSDRETRSAFFEKHGRPLVANLSNEEKISLMGTLRHPNSMHEEALAVLRAVRTDGMDDEALRNLANFATNYEGEDVVLRYIGKIKDQTLAARTRFDYYYRRAQNNGDFQQKALADVPVLRKSPEHAQDIIWAHANLVQWQGQLEEAIKLYRAANRQPDSTWAVIGCLVSLKRYDEAVKQAQELEMIGGDIAAEACLRVADIYRSSGDKSKEVQQLQLVLRRYPRSSQSSVAHGRLESYGVRVIGGEATAED